MGCDHTYTRPSADAAQAEWFDESACEVWELQEEMSGLIDDYNTAIQTYNSKIGNSAYYLKEIDKGSINSTSSQSVMEAYSTLGSQDSLNSYFDAVDTGVPYIDSLEDGDTKDDLQAMLTGTFAFGFGDVGVEEMLSDLLIAGSKMAELLEDFLAALPEEETPDSSTPSEEEAAADEQQDEDAATAKAAADEEKLEVAAIRADYPKMTFKEQCYLLAKIFSFVKYKQEKVDSSEGRKLPYYGDNTGHNAPLGVDGDPYGFMNRLVQHPAQSQFFDMKTEQISSLQPMIRLYKIESEDNEPIQREFMFDSYASKSDVASLFDKKDKRGFGVGIKNFSFTYDGNNPFAAKKSIKAQLTIFASSFDELLVDRGGYKYADLALKTGGTTTQNNTSQSDECNAKQEAINNLAELSFRLKAVVGWARPSGDTNALFPGTDSEKNALLDAIGESYVTLNLTPTVHEFKIDEMGRVNFVCNYLAYVEDFFDQPQFDVFFEENAAINTISRKYKYQKLSKDCNGNAVGDWKKELAASGAITADKYKNLQSLMDRMVKAKKIRNVALTLDDAIVFQSQGPFFEPEDTADVTGTSGAEAIEQAMASSQQTLEAAAAEEGDEVKEADPVDRGVNVSFFYVSDLLEIILAGIDDRLTIFTNAKTWDAVEIDSSDRASVTEREIAKHQRFQEGYKKFRVLLGPLEIVNPRDTSQFRHVNFGDIPISTKYFMSWLTQKMVKTDQPIYNLATFLNDFFNTLLRDFLNNDSCFGAFSTKQKARLNQAAITSYKDSTSDYDEVTQWITSSDDGDVNAAPNIASMNHPVLNVSGPQDLPIGDGGLKNEINYLVFFAARTQPQDKMVGIKKDDEEMGIFHYLLGRPRGIVKNVSLTRTDAKYLKEVRFEQEGFQGLEQLREVYDANVECYANVKTFPGTYIFVDPRSFMPNKITYGSETLDLTMFGIGGYYMIIRSEHNFGPGTANTKLTAKWVAQIDHELECDAAHPTTSGDGSVTKCSSDNSNAGVN